MLQQDMLETRSTLRLTLLHRQIPAVRRGVGDMEMETAQLAAVTAGRG